MRAAPTLTRLDRLTLATRVAPREYRIGNRSGNLAPSSAWQKDVHMLTRLQVSGFKNLEEVDLHFGPFTCIAGGNAVGKSNLFDAIMFLGALSDTPLIEAAMAVRDKQGRSTDIRSLFHARSNGHSDRMTFLAEMVIPQKGIDDLGQTATASITLIRYRLEIILRAGRPDDLRPVLQIASEDLDYVSIGDARKSLPFRPSAKWVRSVVHGRRTSPFISTDRSGSDVTIRLHQDGRAGRAKEFLASLLPRTVLSTVNAAESPTASSGAPRDAVVAPAAARTVRPPCFGSLHCFTFPRRGRLSLGSNTVPSRQDPTSIYHHGARDRECPRLSRQQVVPTR